MARSGEDAASEPVGGVQSVDRAVTVLEILARRGTAGVSEIAVDLGVHKSTAFRLLGALEERGLVEQSGERGKYQLGFGILRLANAIPARMDMVHAAHPVLEELALQFDETVNLAVLRAHFAVNVDQAQGSARIASQNWVGQLTPLHATSSGKVLLAHLDDDARDRIVTAGLPKHTARTITTVTALRTELSHVRDTGRATALEEYEEGLNGVAVPVRDHLGLVAGAVSVSGPAFRFDAARIDAILDELTKAAGRISDRLGFH